MAEITITVRIDEQTVPNELAAWLTVASLMIAVFGLLAAVYFWIRPRPLEPRMAALASHHHYRLDQHYPRLSIRFDDSDIESFYAAYFVIKNTGRTTISRTMVHKPISLMFERGCEILGDPKVLCSNRSIEPTVTLIEDVGLSLDFDYLNPGDTIEATVLSTLPPAKPCVQTSIEGLEAIEADLNPSYVWHGLTATMLLAAISVGVLRFTLVGITSDIVAIPTIAACLLASLYCARLMLRRTGSDTFEGQKVVDVGTPPTQIIDRSTLDNGKLSSRVSGDSGSTSVETILILVGLAALAMVVVMLITSWVAGESSNIDNLGLAALCRLRPSTSLRHPSVRNVSVALACHRRSKNCHPGLEGRSW